MRLVRSFLTFCPAVAVALTAAPLWAEEAGKTKPGLPQLDMGFFPGQIFWLVVAFAILYMLMARFALPGIERTQKKRQGVIATELAAATAANEAAKKTIAEYEKVLADARMQAQTAVNGIAAQAARKSTERQAAQQQALTQRLHEAETRIAAMREAAFHSVQAVVLEIAGATIEKLTGLKLQAKP